MKKITIENTQKDAKWTSKTVEVPENADECLASHGTLDGLYTMALTTSFPVRFRKTNGSQESADKLFRGEFGRSDTDQIPPEGIDEETFKAYKLVKAQLKAAKKAAKKDK